MIDLQKLKLEVFRKEHIPQYLEYAFHSYFQGNKTYNDWGLTKNEFDGETQTLLNLFIQSSEQVNQVRDSDIPFNTFIRIDGKMAVACFSCELHRFMKLLKQGKIPQPMYCFFSPKTLQENPKYTAVITTRHAVNRMFFKNGLYGFHSQQRSRIMMKNDYMYQLGILNNAITLNYYTKRGAQLTPIKIQNHEKVRQIYLFRVPYSNILKCK